MSVPRDAGDDQAARREAILFLSELPRDLAVSKQHGSEVPVEVTGTRGERACRLEARISRPGP